MANHKGFFFQFSSPKNGQKNDRKNSHQQKVKAFKDFVYVCAYYHSALHFCDCLAFCLLMSAITGKTFNFFSGWSTGLSFWGVGSKKKIMHLAQPAPREENRNNKRKIRKSKY